MKLTTLCYIEKDEKYLMIHRIKKKHDVNKDKWIGIGGKFERGESPEDCILRETKEETGLTLTDYRLRGVLTFVYNDDDEEMEYIFLYTADGFAGELAECNEGTLEWVPKTQIDRLNLWEGQYAPTGLSSNRLKGVHILDHYVSMDEYDQNRDAR